MLNYVVWLGIHGRHLDAQREIGDSLSVRLEQLHEEERRWKELEPFQQDTLHEIISYEGSCSRVVELGLKQEYLINRFILPCREDPTPPLRVGTVHLSPYKSYTRAWDSYEDVLIILLRCVLFSGFFIIL
jgi:hypothetical protein